MQFQFNCPQCGLAMQASVESGGGAAECPECGKQFVVEAPVQEIPVVKARAVPASGQQHPPRGRGTPPTQARRPQPAARQHAAPSPAKKEGAMLFVGLAGAGALLVALVVWFNVQARKVVNQAPPRAEEVSAIIAAVPPKVESAVETPSPEKARMDEELEKIKNALAAT